MPGGIGSILQQDGVVSDGGRFRNYAKEQGQGSSFKAGRYQFRAGTDYDVIIRALDNGAVQVRLTKLVVPEGFRNSEIAARVPTVGISTTAYNHALARARPPAGFGHPRSMEGFLFPATYPVRPHERAATLIAQQEGAFQQEFSQVNMSYARSKNLTNYDVLTIASMIEREARVDKDRALIAAVIYNRLHLGMTLGIDATLLYEYGSWTHQLTDSELVANTPVQHARAARTAADADLQPGAEVAAGGRAPRARRLPLLRREARRQPLLHQQLPGLPEPWRVSDGSVAARDWPA